MLHKHLIAQTKPLAREKQTFLFSDAGVRLTLITPRVLRVEEDAARCFTDDATQIVWFRDTGAVDFSIEEHSTNFLIKTAATEFTYDKRRKQVISVKVDDKRIAPNNDNNLLGTRRTLDATRGRCKLENGLMSYSGVAVINDDSLILGEDGMVHARNKYSDKYIFVGLDYPAVLQDFYKLTGRPPLVPRAVLGNWWSRYHAYSQEEYLNLMSEFENKGIPFTIATIDMDWHWVDLSKQFNKMNLFKAGWTGYSFNTELFPNHREMLNMLHNKGYKNTLNLHPAQGVRAFETQYPAICEALDIDPATKKTVPFDLTRASFINAYFDCLHHPLEKDGVDFWWIDWQQGKKSALKGYDPLWGLNHYHTLDNAKNNTRPVVLSRYAKLGSHRYPLGFSGDTFVKWSTLAFQPYFTATATNSGYVAWSHDIGGHLMGAQKDDELYLRWIQFGVFSPILRLHSTKNALSKEPWNHPTVEKFAVDSLQFRHRLIPYIYTAFYRAYSEGRGINEPLYYRHPKEKNAHFFPNEYYFGSELLVHPITAPTDPATSKSSVEVWLPEDARYTDIFTKECYSGGQVVTLTRGLNSIPVLAKEGAIIPLANNINNDYSNPLSLELMCASGNGTFTLYEDDGASVAYKTGAFVTTTFCQTRQENCLTLTIKPASGDVSLIPNEREYVINILDMVSAKAITVTQNNNIIAHTTKNNMVVVSCVNPSDTIIITYNEVTFK
ncbi:MAG: glycoside hydrolase family 31 protein [Bacillota bacterium]